MKLISGFRIITVLLFVFLYYQGAGNIQDDGLNHDSGRIPLNSTSLFSAGFAEKSAYHAADSLHCFNFRYADKKRGVKPFIAPVVLLSSGTALHFMTGTKEGISDFAREKLFCTGYPDDYIQHAPLVAVYSLHALGIKGKNNFGNLTAITAKSLILNSMITDQLKTRTHVKRPSGGMRSFPSGHTSHAFALAHIMHREYGETSVWYSIGAYTCATATGMMRVAKGAHWVSDVFAGAGVGILSTELVYLTHQYKWDNEHLKRLDIFPFSLNRQKGITLVYTFR